MTPAHNATALAACPFCGGTDPQIADTGSFWVKCSGCFAEGPAADTEDEAIRLWNRAAGLRAAQTPDAVCAVTVCTCRPGPCATQDATALADRIKKHLSVCTKLGLDTVGLFEEAATALRGTSQTPDAVREALEQAERFLANFLCDPMNSNFPPPTNILVNLREALSTPSAGCLVAVCTCRPGPCALADETALSAESELTHYRPVDDGAMVESRVINSHQTYVKSVEVRTALKSVFLSALRGTSQTPDAVREALDRIWDIVHTPTKATNHRAAERHFMADFDAIRQVIKDARPLSTPSASAGPQAEAVAWQARDKVRGGIWHHCDYPHSNPDYEYRPLYAHPQPHHADGRGAVIEALKAAEQQLVDLASPICSVFNRSTKKYEFTDAHIEQALPGTFETIKQIRAALQQSPATDGAVSVSRPKLGGAA